MNWIEKDRELIWHPFTPQKESPEPIFIESGKGSWLFDEKGNKYLDAISSWWVNLHGHSHPYIAEKLYQQALALEHIIFAGFTHQPAITLADRLLPLLPGDFSRIFYSDNGSTSTEVALKMALQYWWNKGTTESEDSPPPRRTILAFNNSYHGDTFGAMSVSDRSVFTRPFHDLLFDVCFIDTPTSGNGEELDNLLEKEGQRIAAFIYEPLIQGAGGIKLMEPGLLNAVLEKVKARGIICIADEVMTGFGRTGRLFASDYMEQKPDIICLSKGLTGGVMPLGATACTKKIYEAYLSDDRKKTFFHGHSFTANPLACTAAIASLELLQETAAREGIDRICKMNLVFEERLKEKYQSRTVIKNTRVSGTILAFEINTGEDVYLNEISRIVTSKALEKGVYLRPLGNTVYFMPPYCITENEYGFLTNVTEAILDELFP